MSSLGARNQRALSLARRDDLFACRPAICIREHLSPLLFFLPPSLSMYMGCCGAVMFNTPKKG